MNVRKWMKQGMVMAVAAMLAMPVASARAENCGVPTTNGLVGHWKLDETSGTTAADSSGNANNGTWVNSPVPIGPTVVNRGLHFDKTNNNYISVTNPASAFTTAPFTISGWVYFDDLATTLGDSHIFFRMSHSSSPWNGYQLQLDSSADDLIFIVRNAGGTGYTLTSDNPLEADRWYHVALTLDSSYNAVLYINGSAQADTETPGSLYAADNDLRFGGNNGSGQNLEGAMDDLRFYSRVLSDEEIGQLYTYGLGKRGAMVFNDSRDAIEYCNGTDWVMAGLGSYTPNVVTFDGTTNLETTSALSGVTDGKQASFSMWFKFDDTTAWQRLISDSDSSTEIFQLLLDNGDNLDLIISRPGAAMSDVDITATGAGPSDGNWHHLLVSFDVAAGVSHFYVDDVDVNTENALTDVTLDFTRSDFGVGFVPVDDYNYFNGAMADMWIDFNNYIDFSKTENRRRFISDSGMPMYLGQDGSLPTGFAPDIFLSGDTANWHVNKGTGGGFTENGAITYSSSTPANCIPSAGPFVLEDTYNTSTDTWQVWGDGNYIYAADGTGKLKAFSFDGTSLTLLDTFDTGGDTHAVWGDGTYIYAGDSWGNISALTFDGSSFTQVGSSYGVTLEAVGIWGDGQYIYVADDNAGIEAYTFDGSSFTQMATYDPGNATAVWGDGQYIYVADSQGNGLHVFSFDGNSFTLIDTAATGWVYSVWGDGTYIYVGTNPTLEAFTFDGSSLSQVGSIGGAEQYIDVWTDGTYVYAQDAVNNTINAFTFNGSSFSLVDSDASPTTGGDGIWGDGTYIYAADGSGGVQVFSGFATCNCGVNTRGDIVHKGIMEYNDDFTVMQYCNGTDWVAMGPVGGTPSTDGLVGYWKLDETSGATLTDSSGNGNNGTWTDNENDDLTEEATTGLVDGGLNFEPDATTEGNDHVLIGTPAVLNNLGPMTVCSWAKTLNGTFGANSPMVAKSTGGQTGWQLYFNRAGGDRVGFRTTEQAYKNGSTKMIRNTWSHACATWDGTDTAAGITIYLNGVDAGEFSSADLGTTLDDSTYDLYIGRNLGGSTKWEGGLDEVRIYNRVLSPQEIAQLYQFGMSGGLGDVKNGCVSPAGVEGVIFYNSDYSVMQYCNGEEWIGIGQ